MIVPARRTNAHPASTIRRTTDRSVGRAPDALRWLANERLLGWPVAAVLLLVVAVLAHALLRRTRFGLRLLATGDDPESTRRAGVDVARVRWGAFVAALNDAGYDGPIAIEVEDRAYEGALPRRKDALVISRRYLLQHLSG